jgi:shikimate 5-dehydrogenase
MPNVDGIVVTVPHKFDAPRAGAARDAGVPSSIGAANVVRRSGRRQLGR